MFKNFVYSSYGAKTVLIHADHRRRDSTSTLLIAFYLRELGYNTIIGNRTTTRYLYYKYLPDLVLNTHPDMVFSPKDLEYASSKSIFIFMHPEGSGIDKNVMLKAMRGGDESVGDTYTKYYSKVLTWGPMLKDWVIEAGLFRESQVVVTGNPRYDFYLNKKDNKPTAIGCMPLFIGMSNFDNINMFELINSGRFGKGFYFGEKGGYEDYLWTSAAYTRIYLEFLDKWCLEMKNDVEYRPYPLENMNDHLFFSDRYGEHIKFDTSTPFPEWTLGLSASIFCSTSTIIDSALSGVPYITVQEILGERLEYHQPRDEMVDERGYMYNFTYQPKSIDELVDLATKASEGKLEPRVKLEDSIELQDKLWNNYGWPQKKPSASIVADVIDELLLDKDKNKCASHFSLKVNIERSKSIYRFFESLFSGRIATYNDYNFMFWHNRERSYVESEFKKLNKKTGNC